MVGSMYTNKERILQAYNRFHGYSRSLEMRLQYFCINSFIYFNTPIVNSSQSGVAFVSNLIILIFLPI